MIAQVVDTTGWMSADLHVHAVASADSSVANADGSPRMRRKVSTCWCSTDHDVITDFAPLITALGVGSQMASMIGCEVTPFDFGHQQAFPVIKGEGPTGGAFDWAGGDGATLRLDQLYAGLKRRLPRSGRPDEPPARQRGSLTRLKVDTATGATHEKAETFRMEPNPAATAQDTQPAVERLRCNRGPERVSPNLG